MQIFTLIRKIFVKRTLEIINTWDNIIAKGRSPKP